MWYTILYSIRLLLDTSSKSNFIIIIMVVVIVIVITVVVVIIIASHFRTALAPSSSTSSFGAACHPSRKIGTLETLEEEERKSLVDLSTLRRTELSRQLEHEDIVHIAA